MKVHPVSQHIAGRLEPGPPYRLNAQTHLGTELVQHPTHLPTA